MRFHLASDWLRYNKHSRNILWCSWFYGNDKITETTKNSDGFEMVFLVCIVIKILAYHT